MGLLDTVNETLGASAQRAPGRGGDDGSNGSYWCDDCAIKIRDIAIDAKGLDQDDGTPLCPDCEGRMRFERASGSGCAC